MAKRTVILGLCAITAASLGGLAVYVKAATFPFVELRVVRSIEEFNAPPEATNISYETPPFDPRLPTETGLDAFLAKAARDHLRMGDSVVLNSPEDIRSDEAPALCSEYAKLAVSAATHRGITGRVVWMSGHTVSEFWIDGRWTMIDTNGNQTYWVDGRRASSVDLSESTIGILERLVEDSKNDPTFAQDRLRIYRETDFFVVLEGPRLYDFHRRNRDPLVLLGYLFGGEPVARGIQFVPPGKQPKAGSVIWTVRIALAALAALWITALAWPRRGRAAPVRTGDAAGPP